MWIQDEIQAEYKMNKYDYLHMVILMVKAGIFVHSMWSLLLVSVSYVLERCSVLPVNYTV